eukprot:TRINITY_DN2314_c2_g1_i1.p1 TRINITY_DN2314_c2_g1~~TRINITY_DN2314_c2_g1_i1.p1  ORF type:complete len:538 (+),score=186.77 TRINITY_DN2314_c2_g1_i1:1618-3231(+)
MMEYKKLVKSKGEKFLNEANRLVTNAKGVCNWPLLAARFLRVVLDEGHIIKNAKALMHQGCKNIRTSRRWIISGTPVQNTVQDLYSLVGSFLQVKPLDDAKIWKTLITDKWRRGEQEGYENLQNLMRGLTLRRTKDTKLNGKPILVLPPRTEELLELPLSDYESEKYNSFKDAASQVFAVLKKEDLVMKSYVMVLGILLRLRQLCNHPDLFDVDEAIKHMQDGLQAALEKKRKEEAGDLVEVKFEPENIGELVEKLQQMIDESEDCVICLEPLEAEKAVITGACSHCFCKTCIVTFLNGQQAQGIDPTTCPLCRTPVSVQHLAQLPSVDENDDKQVQAQEKKRDELKQLERAQRERLRGLDWQKSSKIQALIQLLQGIPDGDKTIVFSQWTSMLDVIANGLEDSGIEYCRLDGSMNLQDRSDEIRRFRDDSVPVFLISLKAGGVGLDLTMANRAVLMDPWWNPAVENQAMDRVYRCGQRKEVTVTRFAIDKSVESLVLRLQEKKKAMVNIAMGNKGISAEDVRKLRMDQLNTLFDWQ